MKNAYDAVMFDLDGTLADTLADIAAACNHAIGQLGKPPIELPAYRYLAGQGLEYLIEHALDGDGTEEQIERGMAGFRTYYGEHYTDQTKPFDGTPAVLDALVKSPMAMAVLSNKPDPATRTVMDEVFAAWKFDVIRGALPDVPLKPDPTSALDVASSLGILPERWAYIGDTRVDMETAKRAGFFAVGVLWGFRDEPELRDAGADVIISHPSELFGVLGLAEAN